MTTTETHTHDRRAGDDPSSSPHAPAPPPLPAAARARQRNWEMLSICALALALSAVLQVRPDGRVFFPGLAAHPLPESCLSRSVFGVKCPGCGLTRSFIALSHGDWRASISQHRLGWLMFLAAAAQVPYRLRRIRQEGPSRDAERGGIGRWFGWLLIALLVANWCVEMILGHWH